MYVDTHLIVDKMQSASSRNGAVNGRAIMAFFITTIKRSIAKRNLLGKCLYPHTCQITTTPQIYAHVPDYWMDAKFPCSHQITIWAHDRLSSDKTKADNALKCGEHCEDYHNPFVITNLRRGVTHLMGVEEEVLMVEDSVGSARPSPCGHVLTLQMWMGFWYCHMPS